MPLTVTNTINPIKVTGTTASSTAILTKGAFVKFIKWYKPTTVGHLCNITDGDGNTIVKMYCDTANTSMTEPVFLWVDHIYCDDMDSGELYIYIR